MHRATGAPIVHRDGMRLHTQTPHCRKSVRTQPRSCGADAPEAREIGPIEHDEDAAANVEQVDVGQLLRERRLLGGRPVVALRQAHQVVEDVLDLLLLEDEPPQCLELRAGRIWHLAVLPAVRDRHVLLGVCPHGGDAHASGWQPLKQPRMDTPLSCGCQTVGRVSSQAVTYGFEPRAALTRAEARLLKTDAPPHHPVAGHVLQPEHLGEERCARAAQLLRQDEAELALLRQPERQRLLERADFDRPPLRAHGRRGGGQHREGVEVDPHVGRVWQRREDDAAQRA
eukprot:5973317-Prymnesium_polylepis.1